MVEQFEVITPALHEAAKQNPGRWIYLIEDSHKNMTEVPPEKIIGAWKTDDSGKIVGGFLPNPNWMAMQKPSDYLIDIAKKRPNSFVYEIVKEFREKETVPLDGIIGAWAVDDKGSITNTFFPNPNYRAYRIS